jgi:hypothetical protein
MNIPLLFTFSDRIVGLGFSAIVTSYGRVLGDESEGEVWIYGVEPGAIAASGSDPKEALEAFRQTFADVLRDFAVESRTFAEFDEAIRQFFGSVNEANERDWQAAVAAVRAGEIQIPTMRQEPAESRRFIEVREERAQQVRDFSVRGSEITTTVAA